MELCENDLFIGTFSGLILKYSSNNPTELLSASNVQHTKSRQLGPNSPVTFLRSASALDRLLALCDSTLMVMNAGDLSSLSLSGKFQRVNRLIELIRNKKTLINVSIECQF